MDALEFISTGVSKFMSEGHVIVYRHAPGLFRWGYQHAEDHEELFCEDSFTYRLMASGAERLYRYIVDEGYDSVICPHVFSALMLTEVLKKYDCLFRSAFVSTDYTCSPGTLESRLDMYFVPDLSIMEGREEQADMSKVFATGIPVRRCFYTSRLKAQAKRELGIPAESSHLLVMCGSMGCGPMRRLVELMADALGEDQYMTVVCGTNHALESWLDYKYSERRNIRIRGYTREISSLMDSADLYLTKPGGISTSEATVKALPMVLIDAVSGCEKHNLEYFVKKGSALSAESPEGLSELCLELLSDRERLQAMERTGAGLDRGNAAELIYEHLKAASLRPAVRRAL